MHSNHSEGLKKRKSTSCQHRKIRFTELDNIYDKVIKLTFWRCSRQMWSSEITKIIKHTKKKTKHVFLMYRQFPLDIFHLSVVMEADLFQVTKMLEISSAQT